MGNSYYPTLPHSPTIDEVGIQRLESRQIDAESIRTNLKRFTEVFEKLTLPERKDFLRLLLKESPFHSGPC